MCILVSARHRSQQEKDMTDIYYINKPSQKDVTNGYMVTISQGHKEYVTSLIGLYNLLCGTKNNGAVLYVENIFPIN